MPPSHPAVVTGEVDVGWRYTIDAKRALFEHPDRGAFRCDHRSLRKTLRGIPPERLRPACVAICRALEAAPLAMPRKASLIQNVLWLAWALARGVLRVGAENGAEPGGGAPAATCHPPLWGAGPVVLAGTLPQLARRGARLPLRDYLPHPFLEAWTGERRDRPVTAVLARILAGLENGETDSGWARCFVATDVPQK